MFGLSLTSTVTRLQSELAAKESELTARMIVAESKDAVIQAKDRVIASLNERIADKDILISDRNVTVDKLRDDIQHLNEKLVALQQTLTDSQRALDASNLQCHRLENDVARLKVQELEVCKLRKMRCFPDKFREILSKIFSDDKSPIFISGPAGTGKSSLIDLVCKIFRAAHPSRAIQVVAPTGIAAQNIDGGRTIHSFFKFAPKEWKPKTGLMSDDQNGKIIRCTDILIIDEVSMLSPSMLDAIDEALRELTGNSSLLFGGTKVVLVGDLAQLPPIYNQDQDIGNNRREYGKAKPHFFDAHVLSGGIEKIFLNDSFRQSEHDFIKALSELRKGRVSPASAALFDKRFEEHPVPPNERTTLFPTNKPADELNQRAFDSLPGAPVVFDMKTTGRVSDNQKDSCKYPLRLEVKVGARVMMLENELPTYCNGTIGVVTEILEDVIKVRGFNNNVFEVYRSTIEFKTNHFNPDTGVIEQKPTGTISQFPMKLAWGITIHKGQGQTLDDVYVDLDGVFAAGHAYTALSRVRTKAGLHLLHHFNAGQVIFNSELNSWFDSD